MFNFDIFFRFFNVFFVLIEVCFRLVLFKFNLEIKWLIYFVIVFVSLNKVFLFLFLGRSNESLKLVFINCVFIVSRICFVLVNVLIG